MFKKKRVYVGILIVIVIMCIWGFLWSWIVTRDIRKNVTTALNQSQKVTVSNIILTETKNEKKYWELYAKSGDYESSTGLVVLNEIIGNFYDEKLQVIMSFESDKGYFYEKEKRIVLSGNNLMVSKEGYAMSADKVIWKGKDEDILAKGNVQLRHNEDILTYSDEATFKSDLTAFKIIGNTKIEIFQPDKMNARELTPAKNKETKPSGKKENTLDKNKEMRK